MRTSIIMYVMVGVIGFAYAAHAQYDGDDYEVDVQNGFFETKRLEVPKDQKFKIEIDNESDSTVEFFVPALDLELVTPAHTEREVYIGPISEGEYPFENSLDSSMTGVMIVK